MKLNLILLLLMSLSAEAKVFRNSYISFDLPDRWDCHLEGTEWICRSILQESSRESIIIVTAKEIGPSDSFQGYENYLKGAKKIPAAGGKPSQSEVKHVRQRMINSHNWVDGMHLGSEIPSYYTRYLATIKDKIAILVTFSAHQKHFTKYSNDFFKSIESMQVLATNDLLKQPGANALRPGSETLGLPGQGAAMESESEIEDYPEEPTSTNSEKIIGLVVVFGALGAYFYLKKGQKKR